MLTLYVKTRCPYSAKVLLELAGVIHASEKSEGYRVLYIDRDEEARRALVQAGGEEKVPFLVDPGADRAMYESDDIVTYLKGKYAD